MKRKYKWKKRSIGERVVENSCGYCKKSFSVKFRRRAQKYCSAVCKRAGCAGFWRQNLLKQREQHFLKNGKVPSAYISDQQMLEAWNTYKESHGSISLEEIFSIYGFKKRPDRLCELVGKEEYVATVRRFSRMGNRYRSGRRYEHKARLHLQADGYYVTRSAGSKGVWDLIALHPTNNVVRLIQVKHGRPPNSIELNTMKQFPCHSDWSKELWVYHRNKGVAEIIILKNETVMASPVRDNG